MENTKRKVNQRAITTSNKVVAKEKNNKRGITLIALVVTIVILLILAGITLNLVLSDDGIFSKATDAKNRWAEAEQNETNALNSLYEQMKGLLDGTGNGGGNTGGNIPATLASLMETVATENETVEDINGNEIVVPAGFKIVANGTSDVVYNYDSTNYTPCVQDGIVIENATDGNQFVWVPIGEINNKDSSKTTIALGRYTFDDSGNPTCVQEATNYTEEIAIETSYKELATSSYGNATALDLEEWITTAQENGGYYVGRYEASKNGTKAASKPSTGFQSKWNEDYDGPASPITDGMLWNFITQPDASTAARNMYKQNGSNGNKYYSDLINSYAYDTAIVFIQEYSGYLRGTTKYSRENGKTFSKSLKNTGANGDKVCNIYDMASNTMEWTTETYTYSSNPCTNRGGNFDYNSYYTGNRYSDGNSWILNNLSFRSTLYVKQH